MTYAALVHRNTHQQTLLHLYGLSQSKTYLISTDMINSYYTWQVPLCSAYRCGPCPSSDTDRTLVTLTVRKTS